MKQRLRTIAVGLVVVLLVVVALPFHIAVTEWLLTQGEMVLSYCGQLLGGAPTGDRSPAPPQ